MSQLAGAPVRLQFMRWDEHGWDNYGPAQLTDIRGGVDANGKIVALEYTALRHPRHLADRSTTRRGSTSASRCRRPGSERVDTTNSGTQYNIAEPAGDREVAAARRQLLQDVVAAGAAGSADVLRLGAVDRRARLRGGDGSVPVPAPEHLDHALTDGTSGATRSSASAKLANWQPQVAASNLSNANVVTGRGIALGGFARLAGRRGRRHRGEQEDRQDRRRRTRTPRRSPASPSTSPGVEKPDGRAT